MKFRAMWTSFCGAIYLVTSLAVAQDEKFSEIVQVTDVTAVNATVTNVLIKGKFVSVESISLFKPSGQEPFVVMKDLYSFECGETTKVALLARGFNMNAGSNKVPNLQWEMSEGVSKKFDVATLLHLPFSEFIVRQDAMIQRKMGSKYKKRTTPNPVTAVGEFACQAIKKPYLSSQIATEVRQSGGLTDLSKLNCLISSERGDVNSMNIIFSEADGYVQSNGRWMTSSFVNDIYLGYKELIDGSTLEVDINRMNGKIRAHISNNITVFQGECVTANNNKNGKLF